MDSIILAGGYAVRMSPLTDEVPKSLLPVAGTPVLSHLIQKLNKFYSTHKGACYLAVSKKYEADFRNFLKKENPKFPIRLVLEESNSDRDKFGLIKAVKNVIDNEPISVEEGVLILAGDGVLSLELGDLYNYYKKYPSRSVLALYNIKDLSKAKLYGCVKLADKEDSSGRLITSFDEKPKSPSTAIVNTTCLILNKVDLMKIEVFLSRDRSKNLFEWLIKDNKAKINGLVFNSYWFDIGEASTLSEANKFVRGLTDE